MSPERVEAARARLRRSRLWLEVVLAAWVLADIVVACAVSWPDRSPGPLTMEECDAMPELEAREVPDCREYEYNEALRGE